MCAWECLQPLGLFATRGQRLWNLSASWDPVTSVENPNPETSVCQGFSRPLGSAARPHSQSGTRNSPVLCVVSLAMGKSVAAYMLISVLLLSQDYSVCHSGAFFVLWMGDFHQGIQILLMLGRGIQLEEARRETLQVNIELKV